jgi:hypothetical protein
MPRGTDDRKGTTMEKRAFGKTGLDVTPLGYGGAEIGIEDVSADDAQRVLETVLDEGINLIDTAACYGDSEEKIGQAISGRRDEYVLVTKCGHSRDGIESDPWTAEVVFESIERSLKRLKTDHVDLVLLHSCDAEKLDDDSLLSALERIKQQGKTRSIGYSGDNEAAEKAVGMELFDALETSVNITDQQSVDRVLPKARERDLGVLAKRPMANGCWRDLQSLGDFYSEYAKPYAERLKAMEITPESVGFDGGWAELALRFSAHMLGVTVAIVGSTKLKHIRENVRIVEQGPLPEDVVTALRQRWTKNDDGSWTGQT